MTWKIQNIKSMDILVLVQKDKGVYCEPSKKDSKSID